MKQRLQWLVPVLWLLAACSHVQEEEQGVSRQALGSDASACQPTVLTARRDWQPSRKVDGELEFRPARTLLLPGVVNVTAGNAGNKKVKLEIELAGGGEIKCTYRGGAASPHPTTPADVAAGLVYVWESCGGGLVPGASFTAKELELEVQGGDSQLPRTAVSMVFAGPGCGGDAGAEAGVDAGVDAASDAGVDAGRDGGTTIDAGLEGGVLDSGSDAGSDAGLADAGSDAGRDAGGVVDAGPTCTAASCSDGNACNGVEVCNANGTCSPGTPPVVDDGNVCTVDACNAEAGVTHVPAPVGVSCTDGNVCNGAETCNGAGACVPGMPVDPADGNLCTVDRCDPTLGVIHDPAVVGTDCSDGNVCNGVEACNGAGACAAGTPPALDDGNDCTADSCSAQTGVTHVPLTAGTSCADANVCNGAETCNGAGLCTSGAPLVVNDGNPCTVDVCDAVVGVSHVPAVVGSSCSDQNACNGDETCDGAGACSAGTPPVVDDGNPCTADACNAVTGATHTPVAAGTSCSDSDACNGSETCNGAGACSAGAPPVLDDGNLCTVDTCDPRNGVSHLPATTGGCNFTTAPNRVVDPSLPIDVPADAEALFVSQGGTIGALAPRRAAIVTGRVFQGLSGQAAVLAVSVEVGVLGHPELGTTRTEANGSFALAVNGGGPITLTYSKSGLISGQRQVQTQWNQIHVAPDIELIAHDDGPGTVVIQDAQTMQVARGRLVSEDSAGPRQATLIVPPGTHTTNFSSPTGAYTIHLTEFTVGPNGPRRMPADLPPTSGYTYAFEASIEEATAAGVKRVDFNQALPFYVENFLSFPVGESVPLGYYDESRGAWIAEKSGRVVKIVGITGGRADLDVTGDDIADVGPNLSSLGIAEPERIQLAQLYGVGKTLWRSEISHFTPWDCNWITALPPFAKPPRVPDPKAEESVARSCKVTGASTIDCQNQVLNEDINVSGSPFSLHYQSDRSVAVGRRFLITLTGPTPFAAGEEPIAIAWQVRVAGRLFSGRSNSVAPNQVVEVPWDGLDAFGRAVQGRVPADIGVGNVYFPRYKSTEGFASFSLGASIAIGPNIARTEITVWNFSQLLAGGYIARGAELGGWTLDVAHTFQAATGDIFRGDGTHAATGRGLQALQLKGAEVRQGQVVQASSDGNVYFLNSEYDVFNGGALNASQVLRLNPSGEISTIAGQQLPAQNLTPLADGVPALNAQVVAREMKVSPQGEVHVVSGNQVWRITNETTPVMRLVAGNGSSNCTGLPNCGDGGKAVDAVLNFPASISFGPDGSLYLAEVYGQRIRRVLPDGKISTLREGQAYTQVVSAPNGDVWFVGDIPYDIYKISATGGTTLEYADPRRTVCGETAPSSFPILAFGPQGDPLLACKTSIVLLPSGARLAGSIDYNPFSAEPTRGPALSVPVADVTSFSNAPDGTILITDRYGHRRLTASLGAFGSTTGTIVPSEDGSELYQFTLGGKHLRTLSSQSGVAKWQFGYDNAGRMVSITDVNGLITRVERDASGRLERIVAPHGQTTTLTLNAERDLTAIRNPQGETWSFDMNPGGLMTRAIDPRAGVHIYQYGSDGRLTSDTDAEGKVFQFAKISTGEGWNVTHQTPENRSKHYSVSQAPSGEETLTYSSPAGSTNIVVHNVSGSQSTFADGTTIKVTESPDPRFDRLAPLRTVERTSPSGLRSVVSERRTTLLANPQDPTSVTTDEFVVAQNAADCALGSTCTQVTAKQTYNRALGYVLETTPKGRYILSYLDAKERPTRIQMSGQAQLLLSYDSEGRLARLEQDARRIVFGYGTDGYLAEVTDPIGRTVHYGRDAVGRVTNIALPGGRGVQVGFDAMGNPVAVTPPGSAMHNHDFDLRNLLTSYRPPAASGVSATESATAYAYNGDRQLTLVNKPDGTVTLNYGSVSGLLDSVLSPDYTHAYTYDSAERVSQIVGSNGVTLSYAHDGDLLVGTTWSGSVLSGAVTYTHNNHFKRLSTSIAGVTENLQWDEDDLLVGVSGLGSPLTVTRDAGNGRISRTVTNAVSETRGYDSSYGELATLSTSTPAESLYSVSYLRDMLGRVVQKNETRGAASETTSYEYDLAGRLVREDQSAIGGPVTTWDYDANGNRTMRNGVVVASFDAQDRLTNTFLDGANVAYTYSSAGNLTQKAVDAGPNAGATSYTWDRYGSLLSATLPPSQGGATVAYVLDGQSRRVARKVNGSFERGWLYDGQLRVVAELNATGVVQSRFVYATRSNVPDTMVRGATTYKLVTDQLGSVRLVVDSALGTVVQEIKYDAWGRVLSDTNPGFQPFGFAGGMTDAATGLVHFGARDYDPSIGRWISKDPSRFGGGLNLYGYCDSDPVDFVDATGRMKLPADPSGLGPGWTRDYGHLHPNGERWTHASGDVLEFHRGDPNGPRGGFQRHDHWHHSSDGRHNPRLPGDEVPDPPNACRDTADPVVDYTDDSYSEGPEVPFFFFPWLPFGLPLPSIGPVWEPVPL